MAELRDFFQGASNAAASNLSAPVDGIAWLLRKAGVPIQNPVGGSDWMRAKGLTAEPQNRMAGLLGESFGGVAPIFAAAKAPQIAAGLLKTQDAAKVAGQELGSTATNKLENYMAKNGMIQPITVWHGSPHKFDKFDSAKIGTGEGNQAFGQGTYVAEAQSVGTQYKDVLASPRNRVNDKRGVYVEPSPMGDGTWRLGTTSEIGQMRGQTGDATQGLTDYDFKSVAAAVRHAKKNGMLSKDEKPLLTEIASEGAYNPVRAAAQMEDPLYNQLIASDPGYLYKVDLPDEHLPKMLDWDKPLGQQSAAVQKAIAQSKAKLPPNALDDLGGDLSLMYGPDVTPEQFLNTWESFGAKAGGETALRDAGIPGIRYLDGGSRYHEAGGTSNFVVFPGNESLLTILERNGQPINKLNGLLGQ